MRVVHFLLPLLASNVDVVAACGDNVIAAVGAGVVDGLVLAHQELGDGGCDPAEGPGVGTHVDVVPCAGVGEAGLRALA